MIQEVQVSHSSVVEFVGKVMNEMGNLARYLKIKEPVIYYYESEGYFDYGDTDEGVLKRGVSRDVLKLEDFVRNFTLPSSSEYSIFFGEQKSTEMRGIEVKYGKPVVYKETASTGEVLYYTFRIGTPDDTLELEVQQANRISFVYTGVHPYYYITKRGNSAKQFILQGVVDNYDGGGILIGEVRTSKESKVGFGTEKARELYPKTKAEVHEILNKYFQAGDEFFISKDAEILILSKKRGKFYGFTRIVYNRRYN